MAGTDPTGGFDADETRGNLRAAMLMGLPQDQAQRPIFLFPRQITNTPEDQNHQPWDWTAAPATDTNPHERSVTCGDGADQVVCTWEGSGGRGGTQAIETELGAFDFERLVITMLDVDYAKVAGFNRVKMSGNTYRVQFEVPQTGLYDMSVHQIVVGSEDES